ASRLSGPWKVTASRLRRPSYRMAFAFVIIFSSLAASGCRSASQAGRERVDVWVALSSGRRESLQLLSTSLAKHRLPPIERVQGPDVKGALESALEIKLSFSGKSNHFRKSDLKQQIRIILNCKLRVCESVVPVLAHRLDVDSSPLRVRTAGGGLRRTRTIAICASLLGFTAWQR